MATCSICSSSISPDQIPGRDALTINCRICGRYDISRTAFVATDIIKRVPGFLLSAAIREANSQDNKPFLSTDNIDSIVTLAHRPSNPIEAIDKILLYIKKKNLGFHDTLSIDVETDYPIACAKDHAEFSYFLNNAIALGYLENPIREGIRVTIDGWNRIDEVMKVSSISDQAFVAMWFDPEMNEIWTNGIYKALEGLGYKPLRIDKKEFNNKIDDEIIAEIKRSGLVVADFTGHRQGVYFEAGFAMGLGIPVIWLCNENEIESAHFDTRQYNHIPWKSAEDLYEKLQNRIRATLKPPRK